MQELFGFLAVFVCGIRRSTLGAISEIPGLGEQVRGQESLDLPKGQDHRKELVEGRGHWLEEGAEAQAN